MSGPHVTERSSDAGPRCRIETHGRSTAPHHRVEQRLATQRDVHHGLSEQDEPARRRHPRQQLEGVAVPPDLTPVALAAGSTAGAGVVS